MRESFEDHGQYRWVINCDTVVGGKISVTWSKADGLVHGFTIFVDNAPQSLWDALELNKGQWAIDVKRTDCFFNKTAAKKELFMRKLRGECHGT